ncbi:pentapeptide repeat-containing protein [Streptomyces sp900116325]|uniref:pentapeptide repeat-containing protein n=1 Tax=Streptomyces sp. 900116325 TaxID=3154295 RepID=UPI0033A3E90A
MEGPTQRRVQPISWWWALLASAPPDIPEPELAGLSVAQRAAASGAHQAARAAWEQERVVRVTAQRILTQHLFTGVGRGPDPAWPLNPAPEEPKFWPGIDLDLTAAVLLDFEFAGRRVESANFERCQFVGGANFAYSEFIRHANFRGARFEKGSGHFMSAWFGLRAMFLRTDFGDEKAVFDGATFTGMTFFEGAVMGGGVSFEAARALADFNRNWGAIRQLPEGWTERAWLRTRSCLRWRRGSAGGLRPTCHPAHKHGR